MRNAIVCNTPLQVLNALNITVNDVESSKNNTDLFLIMSFRNCEEVYNQLCKTSVFNNIVKCKRTKNKNESFINLLFYSRLLSLYEFSQEELIKTKYDNLFISDRNLVGVLLHMKSKCRVFAFDDGIASYDGNCIKNKNNYRYPFLNYLFKTDVLSYNIQKLYVNNAEYCNSKICENISQLPKLNDNNPVINIAKQVFGYKNNVLIENHRIIILEQPLDKKKNYNGLSFKKTISDLEYNNNNPLVRLHPVQKDIKYLFDMDNVCNLWELDCVNSITDDNILISYYSTAQFSPKMIADKEPYLIFLYRIFSKNLNDNEIKSFENMINIFSKKYENGKIYIPNNIGELQDIIKELV